LSLIFGDKKFDLANSVVSAIHKFVQENGTSYLDAIIHHSECSGLEIEVIAEIVSRDELIKSKLEVEAENLNFIKRTSRLPI
jgi:hypothetical protein